jgi:hypothetical protein
VKILAVCVGLAAAIAGCTLDRAVIAIVDGAGERDAFVSLDAASIDAERMDAAVVELDAFALDAAEPDVGPPDTGPPDSGDPDTGLPGCDVQYATAAGYMLCEERPTECEFVSLLEGMRSCGSTCAALGGRCIDAYRNELPFPPCERQGDPIGCDVLHQDDICICSRGP